jgi:hypothetical protein
VWFFNRNCRIVSNGITEQTYYRWRKERGGLKGATKAKRLKERSKLLAELRPAANAEPTARRR